MCGITGFIDFTKRCEENTLNSMRDSITYRGPDDFGSKYISAEDYNIGLAHRRLSIQDLSSLGHQPMVFENLTIVYNGEVYNFKQIREELEQLGYSFISKTDTEVILKAFHAWGVKCVDKFRGMFAFCIYDKAKEKIYIFRDRAGVKPLYYYKNEGLFLFGSELKSFHKNQYFKKEIEKEVLPLYFRFGYVPSPYSIFKNCWKLKAGYYLKYKIDEDMLEEICYWDLKDFYEKEKSTLNEEETLKKLENILKESFALRMISDVPVGVFLSGGVDSSLVASLLQHNNKSKIKTFTIGFEDGEFDESYYAKQIASHIGSEHTMLKCSSSQMLDLIKELPYLYDEPFGDSSSIPTMLVSKLAKEKVSVVLSGDGGDEAFVGYTKYFALNKVQNMSGVKKSFVKILLILLNEKRVELLNNLLPKKYRQKNIKDKYSKFKNAFFAKSFEEMFFNASSYTNSNILKVVSSNNSIPKSNLDFLSHMMYTDYKTFLCDDVLTKVDRASMFYSLEAREPLLDHKIFEFAATIPNSLKYKNQEGKYLLKKILYKYVPKELIERPKSGFQVPLEKWLRDDLKELVNKYLSYEQLSKSDIYNIDEVLKEVDNLNKGIGVNFSLIWFILMFEMWKEEWL